LKVDLKGRLTIPANALAALGSGTEFFITSEDGKFARVYPLKIWKEVEKRLAAAHLPEADNLLVRAKYFGQPVTMDKQGRLLIPMVLRQSAHIAGEVDVLGYTKHLDVWNQHSFLKNLRRSSVTPRDEQMLNKLLYN
jgi:MraZ protein